MERSLSYECHGRNAVELACEHPFESDQHAQFEESTHTYTVHGKIVKQSCTAAKADLFPKMNALKTIDTYYYRWKQNDQHYLHNLIWNTLNASNNSDDAAKGAIEAHWKKQGECASSLGTKLHLYIELFYNNVTQQIPTEISHEVQLFHEFVKSDFYVQNQLQIVRTEFTIYDFRNDIPVCAGQIDALFKDHKNDYYILDWKRAKHVLKPHVKAFNNQTGTHEITKHIPDTDFHKYSLQLSLYAEMMSSCNGVDVADRLYLIRFHPDLQEFELSKCQNYRKEAKQILNMMYENLASSV